MRSVKFMKAAKIGYIVLSGAMFVLGLLLVFAPDFSITVLGTLCGVLLILFGVVKLIGYFSKDLYQLAFQYDLALGILLIVLGMALLARPERLFTFFCITLGLFFLMDGLLKIHISLEAKAFGIRTWWVILTVSAITSGCGGTLLFQPSESMRVLAVLLGLALLFESILNVCTVITSVKVIGNQQPDIIESVCSYEKASSEESRPNAMG